MGYPVAIRMSPLPPTKTNIGRQAFDKFHGTEIPIKPKLDDMGVGVLRTLHARLSSKEQYVPSPRLAWKTTSSSSLWNPHRYRFVLNDGEEVVHF
jgi:hypothetical protein